MKSGILLSILLSLAIVVNAQSREGSIEYLKKDYKAMVIEFPYSPSVVEDAITSRMEKLGYKKKTSKGFLVYKNAVLSEISSEPADYMIKVERKSRKEKDESVVHLVMLRVDEDILGRNDALINSNARTSMDRLVPEVDAFDLDLEVRAQEKVVERARKKLSGLEEDKEILEKKTKQLQDDLEKNAKSQVSQQQEIEKQEKVLEELKSRRI